MSIQKNNTLTKLRIPNEHAKTMDRVDLNLSNYNTANTATANLNQKKTKLSLNSNHTPARTTIMSHHDDAMFKKCDYLNDYYTQKTEEAPRKRRVRNDYQDVMQFESQDSLKIVSSFDHQLSNPISHQNLRKKSCTPRKEFNGFKKINNIASLYTFGDVIGEGSFGKVRIAVCKKTKQQYAAKIMKKVSAQGQPRDSLL